MLKYYIMNIVLNKREEVLKNNNTAQEEFITQLNKIHKSSDTITIYQSLNGDIDLSMLSEFGFTNLKRIIFNKGNITGIVNVPQNIKELKVSDNLLIELKRLPQEIEVLNIENNYVSQLEFTDLFKLEKLNISHNNFTTLTNLPTTLTELICNNNKIKYINLFELNNLKELNGSDNTISVIDNLPNSIIKLILDNNPPISYHNTNVLPQTVEKDSENNYFECLKEYFKRKNTYETELKKKKTVAFKRNQNKIVGKKLASMVKMPCIYCKRNVGTIFSNAKKHYKAICGDKINPCELKIDIYTGDYFNVLELITAFEDHLTDLRESIINMKLNSIFEYVSNDVSIKLYNKKLEEYSKESSAFDELMDRYNELFNLEANEEKKNLLIENKRMIQEKRDNINKLVSEYKESNNKKLLTEAIDIQINEIIPIIKNITHLEYDKGFIEKICNEDTGECILVKNKISYSNLEYTYGEKYKVISFKVNPGDKNVSDPASIDSNSSLHDYLK